MTAENLAPAHMVVVPVAGLSGRQDVRRISQHLSDLPGVDALRVDLPAGTVTVQGNVAEEGLRSAIVAAGFSVSPEQS